jgi:hypothetical protein
MTGDRVDCTPKLRHAEIRWITRGREGVKKLATARGCCGFGNADKLQA